LLQHININHIERFTTNITSAFPKFHWKYNF